MTTDNPYLPQPAKVLSTEAVTATERLMRLRLDNGQPLGHIAGQFVEVSLLGVGEAPLTIASPPYPSPLPRGRGKGEGENSFEICVRAAGNLTRALHQLAVGDTVGIRGPLGRGFPMEQLAGKDLLFIAGGIGLIPLRPLIKQVLQERVDFGKITLLYGTKTPQERVFMADLQDWERRKDIDYRHTLDRPLEGWTGHVGVVTTFLPELEIDPSRCVVLVVGPPLMYKFVVMGLADKGMADENILLSFERRMKCGIGKCGHCQINGALVCRQGPTFSYAETKGLWEALA